MSIKITDLTISRFIVELYARQADKYGPETSLRELRVIAQCYYIHTKDRRGTSVTELSEHLDMATSTVHRAVVQLEKKGWLVISQHPDDGRKRVVVLSEQAIKGGLWKEAKQWIKEF